MPRYLIAYDISDDRLRRIVSEKLLQMGFTRLSRSVFIGVTSRGRVEDLRRWLKRVLGSDDVVHIVCLCENCVATLKEVRARG